MSSTIILQYFICLFLITLASAIVHHYYYFVRVLYRRADYALTIDSYFTLARNRSLSFPYILPFYNYLIQLQQYLNCNARRLFEIVGYDFVKFQFYNAN